MSQKIVNIEGLGQITLQKRKGARSVRLSIAHDGVIKITMPGWSPYQVGMAFARSKTAWIIQQRQGKSWAVLTPGSRIGKAHTLIVQNVSGQKISTRLTATEILIKIPQGMSGGDEPVQTALKKAATRALKQEATNLLPQRLQTLAAQHGFSYKSVSIKQLKARWGSCSSQKDIALNLFLMQLPWDLIDYVLLHELQHTVIMAHGPSFWQTLSTHVPNLESKRKSIKIHQPTITPQ